MNRLIVRREEDALPLLYDGMPVEIKKGQVYTKGSSLPLSVTMNDVHIQNGEAQGEVVALGSGITKERLGVELKVGDKVRYSKFVCKRTYVDGEHYDTLNDNEIFSVISKEN